MIELLPLQVRACPASLEPDESTEDKPLVIPKRFVRGAMPRPPAENNVVLARAADGTGEQRLALLAVLLVVNGVVARELLVVLDDLRQRSSTTWRWLKRHVADLVAATAPGCDKRVSLITLSDFSTTVLRRHVYRGKRPLVGVDLAFVLVRLAEHVGTARIGFWRGGWTLGMPGWGTYRQIKTAHGGGLDWRPMLHCPYARVKAHGPDGAFIGFSSCGVRKLDDGTVEPLGTWERTGDGTLLPYRGRFHDVLTLASAFGTPGRDLAASCRTFDVGFAPMEYTPGTINAAMVAAVRSEALAVHHLHGALITEGERWEVA